MAFEVLINNNQPLNSFIIKAERTRTTTEKLAELAALFFVTIITVGLALFSEDFRNDWSTVWKDKETIQLSAEKFTQQLESDPTFARKWEDCTFELTPKNPLPEPVLTPPQEPVQIETPPPHILPSTTEIVPQPKAPSKAPYVIEQLIYMVGLLGVETLARSETLASATQATGSVLKNNIPTLTRYLIKPMHSLATTLATPLSFGIKTGFAKKIFNALLPQDANPQPKTPFQKVKSVVLQTGVIAGLIGVAPIAKEILPSTATYLAKPFYQGAKLIGATSIAQTIDRPDAGPLSPSNAFCAGLFTLPLVSSVTGSVLNNYLPSFASTALSSISAISMPTISNIARETLNQYLPSCATEAVIFAAEFYVNTKAMAYIGANIQKLNKHLKDKLNETK